MIPSAQHVRHDIDDHYVIDQIDELLADDNLEVNKDETETESFETVLEQEYTIKEVVGANLNPKLISIVNQLFVKVLSEEKLKEITEKYPKPANMNVNMPLVNKEIWSVVKTNTISTDLKSQKIQNKVVKTSYSLAELIAFLMELKKKAKYYPDDMSKAIRMAMDSMTMLAQANRELDQKRKDTLRPDLSYPSKLLCNPPNGDAENSVFLFGEELGKKVKEMKEANSVSQPSTPGSTSANKYRNNYNYRCQPYKRSTKGYSNNGRPFLSQGFRKTGQTRYQKSWKSGHIKDKNQTQTKS
ncbi:hypothetical protein SNE40_003897 [Patella caerulea]|uniref:Uncharacterized protein n=1 Tax=Patella caerulea TaxID=87958 RepID=A0AAN8K3V8_PATCE